MLQPHQRRPLLIAATIVFAAMLGFTLMPKAPQTTPSEDIMSYENSDGNAQKSAAQDGEEAEKPAEPEKTAEQLALEEIKEQGKKGCEFDTLVGRPFSESLIAAADRPYRVIRPDDAPGEGDKDPQRINLWLDSEGLVEKVTCE